MSLRQFLKNLFFHLHLDLTRNQRYDRLTYRIMKRCLVAGSHCVDIGCHKGEMLPWILKFSPGGPHYAFEPLPEMYQKLVKKFGTSPVRFFDLALSNQKGTLPFHHVVDMPAYSGIQKRKYPVSNPDIQVIEVKTDCLDQVIPPDFPVHFIKLDVEGGEYQVLQGAKALLQKQRPLVLFEFGLGAAECYGTQPDMMFNLFESCQMNISTLQDYLNRRAPLKKDEFSEHFTSGTEYYFIAHP